MSNVIERIERGQSPKHDNEKVVLNHNDFAELLRLAKIGREVLLVQQFCEQRNVKIVPDVVDLILRSAFPVGEAK